MPGTASCFTRRFGRKKLCSTSCALQIDQDLLVDRNVQVVDVKHVVARAKPAVATWITQPPLKLPAGHFDSGGCDVGLWRSIFASAQAFI